MKPIKTGKKKFVSAYNPRGLPTDSKANPWPEPETKKERKRKTKAVAAPIRKAA